MALLGRTTLGIMGISGILAIATLPSFTAANAIFYAFTVISVALTAVYGLRSDWRATAPGRGLLYLTASMSAIGIQGSVSLLTRLHYWHRDDIRSVLFLAVALAVLNLLLQVLAAQREDAETHDKEDA